MTRSRWMRCVGVLWWRMCLSWQEITAGSPKGNATNITTGKSSGEQRWTWSESEWWVKLCDCCLVLEWSILIGNSVIFQLQKSKIVVLSVYHNFKLCLFNSEWSDNLTRFFLHTQWYKLDELFEQERNVRTAMTNRAGLLALMLHQTIQHDPLTTDLRSNKDR